MGNRSWLYLQAGDGDDARTIEFAESNNHFPLLWRVLLADGGAGDAITDQRVFGDAGTPNLVSDARAAHARLSRLASFVVAYPLRGDDPALARQFDALVRHLGESIDAFGDAHGAPRLSANLDELSWLDGGDPDEFIREERDNCTRLWWRVANCMDFRDVRGVRDVLEIDTPADWRDWAWGFGFGGVSHYYFQRQEPPRGVAFAEMFDAGEVHGNWLGYGTFSFRARNGLWGVRREVDDAWHVIVPPEWTNLWTSGARDRRLLWAARDGKVGLLFADGDVDGDGDEMRIVREPAFDAVWDFSGDVACVRVGERFGLVGTDGTWVLEPSLDDFGEFTGGVASASLDGRWGFVDTHGAWVIPPRFDDAHEFVNGAVAAVSERGQWGLIGRDGQWRAPPEWAALEWSSECGAFLARRNGHVGLVDAKGRVVVEPFYAEIATLTDDERTDMLSELGAIRHVVRRDDGRCAIVDGQGHVLTPFDFVNMGALPWLPDDEAVPGELFTRYAIGVLPGEPVKVAICDLEKGATVVQGRYDDVAGLFWGADHGWLACVQDEGGDDVRATVFRADGTVLHPARYTRIGDDALFDDDPDAAAGHTTLMPWYVRRAEVAQNWSMGEPVAALRDDGVPVWLYADGHATTTRR
ncbi:WG repeat-containing protein [Burkholderia cepacia]|uniref:WG repeat-containing protein n=1 Tax=Burkholderia cepacia TaxID=292 RepID=UPI000F5D94E3|nr:WG repeat-containing protein [Burkholderia cepacia]MCA8024874.1 WG repeat-containing protein [Burkholderia cepacia]RRA20636.1 WG repeat-containing protein [Burkholderia cepacia]